MAPNFDLFSNVSYELLSSLRDSDSELRFALTVSSCLLVLSWFLFGSSEQYLDESVKQAHGQTEDHLWPELNYGLVLIAKVLENLDSRSLPLHVQFAQFVRSLLQGLQEQMESVEIHVYRLKVGMAKADKFICSRNFAMAVPLVP